MLRLQNAFVRGNTEQYSQSERKADVDKFKTEAVATRRLLFQCIWEGEGAGASDGEREAVLRALLRLAHRFELVVRLPRTVHSPASEADCDTEEYLVPWLLRQRRVSSVESQLQRQLQKLLHGKPDRSWVPAAAGAALCCRRTRFSFPLLRRTRLPPGFFSRLQARLYRQCAEALRLTVKGTRGGRTVRTLRVSDTALLEARMPVAEAGGVERPGPGPRPGPKSPAATAARVRV